MPIVTCNAAAFAVATIFYAYRAYHDACKARARTLRERVTYMLWCAANATGN